MRYMGSRVLLSQFRKTHRQNVAVWLAQLYEVGVQHVEKRKDEHAARKWG